MGGEVPAGGAATVVVLFRVYGLAVESDEVFGGEINPSPLNGDPRFTLRVFASREPSIPPSEMVMPSFTQGEGVPDLASMRLLRAFTPIPGLTGFWLTVALTAELNLTADAIAALQSAPADQRGAILFPLTHNLFELELHPQAMIAAATHAGFLPERTPVQWVRTQRICEFPGLPEIPREELTGSFVNLAPNVLLPEQYAGIVSHLRELALEKEWKGGPAARLRALGLASVWLLTASTLSPNSPEGFLLRFRCLEALCSLPDQAPDLTLKCQLRAIGRLVRRSEHPERDALLAAFDKMRNDMLRAPLRERFRRLAEQLGMPDIAEDARLFKIVYGARNDYVHANVAEIPRVIEGEHVFSCAADLARRYFAAVALGS